MQCLIQKLKFVASVLLFGLAAKVAVCQSTAKAEVEAIRLQIEKTHRDIDWKAYDTNSTIAIDSINYNLIQGAWKAYNGIFKFNGAVNSMVLTTPLVIEFKDNGYRAGLQSNFIKFTMSKNRIKSNEVDMQGYINKITDHLLVITWDSGGNYTRYYYEK